MRETDNTTSKLPAAGKNTTAYVVRSRSSVDIMQSTSHCLIAAMRVIYFMDSRSAKDRLKLYSRHWFISFSDNHRVRYFIGNRSCLFFKNSERNNYAVTFDIQRSACPFAAVAPIRLAGNALSCSCKQSALFKLCTQQRIFLRRAQL